MICVVGSLNMDLVVATLRLPAPGETISGGPFATYPGGKGANQAVAAARLGAAVTLVGRVGDDAFGAALRTGAAQDGVDVRHVQVATGLASGVALIAVEASGQNTIIIAPGANAALTPDDVVAAAPAITAARVLLLQLESPLPTVQQAASLARAAGVQVVLNPAPACPLPAELLALVDFLIPNEHEAALLAGAASADDPLALAQALRASSGVSHVIVTLGAAGALLLGPEDRPLWVAAHRVNAVDATAAGDAFVAAFAVALSEGCSPQEALAWGNAAGALTVTRHGAQPALPTRAELLALLAATD